MKSLKSLRRVNPFLSACAGITLFACTGEFDVPPADTSSDAPYDAESGEVGVATAQLQTSTTASTTPASILWTDQIQTSDRAPFGFNQIQLERPIGKSVGGSDQVNLTRVPNPIGSGFALKHVATFDNNGARAQAGIYSFANPTFEKQVKSQEGIWIAQEWYFPKPLSAGNKLDSNPWVNLWDFHSVGAGERWDTQPGLMLAEDGSMRVKWTWRKENPETAWSQVALPVGEWFDVEMHYVWTSSGGTVSLWVNGKLALEQKGVKTKGSTHNSVETYTKFYGSGNGGSSWNPSPAVKYTRNTRISGQRIWRDKPTAPVTPTPVPPKPAEPVVPAPPLASVLWTDQIQTSDRAPFGFNQIQLERPIGQSVGGSDQVNLTRVPNPIGSGFALKHVATFDNNGARAQAGIYSFANPTFEKQVKSQEGIWIAQEWYFPKPLSAGNKLDSNPWVNLWDFHSVGAGERWDTQPGLMLAEDGSMRVKWTWRKENPETAWSQVALPVGEWFDVEMHYVWTSSGGTVSLWVNGKLALEQKGVKTKGSTHNSVETYTKFYGSANGGSSWNPSPAVKYTRNTRISGQRIWRDKPTAPVTPTPVPPQPVQPKPPEPVVPAPPLASILWTDQIQTSNSGTFGFNQIQLERPIGQSVGGSSAVNLTRVPNPIGSGFALKHVATFDNNGGARAQAGIYSFANPTFEKQVKSPEGIWIAQEWYFPEPLSAGNKLDSNPWVNLWDFHSVGAGERWHTQPGLMLAEDGSMRVKWSWSQANPETAWSQIDLPVGEWFDVEMHYVWTSSGGTVSLWVNGDLALEQKGVKTKGSTHNSVETYMKFYGSANGGPSWSPSPSVKYTRNVRISNQRIWR